MSTSEAWNTTTAEREHPQELISATSSRVDYDGAIARVWETLRGGGIALVANDVGYGIWGASPGALEKIFGTKKRGLHKRHAMTVDIIGQREIHVLDQRRQDMIECITQDYDLPLGAIARYRPDHPLIQAVDKDLFKASSANETVGFLINGGRIHKAVGKLARENLIPVFGSSANLSGTGTKYRVEDVQPEIRDIADLVVDLGLRKYHLYQRSSTLINFETMQVLRIGSCYDLISDVMLRHFGVELPADPGRDVNASGHLQEFALPSFR